MDPFDLDFTHTVNNSLYFLKSNSNDSLNCFDDNDFVIEKDNQCDNFTENFNKIFAHNSADNNEDSFSLEDNFLNINNVENFIIYFQNQLNNYYYNKDFDGIIAKIEKKFPFFFNEKNVDFIYMIEKLKFFKLLADDKIEEAEKFYQEKLLILIKEIKKQNWEQKSKFFISLLKKPNLIGKHDDYLNKYYDQYVYELEKAIRIYLHEEKNDINENDNINDFLVNSNNNINIYSSWSSEFGNISKLNNNHENNDDNYKSNKKTDDGDSNKIIHNNNDNNENEKDDLDLENRSTKEEFSDFEDELQPKLCARNEEESKIKEKDENHIDNNQQNEEQEELIIDTSSKKNHIYIEDKPNDNYEENKHKKMIDYSLYNNIKDNKEIKRKKKKEKEIIFNQLPFLKSFKPKYIKRETIDKKIIRNFKNYIVKEYKEKRFEINNKNM